MTDLVFGRDTAPTRSAEKMAYVGRHRKCQHIRVLRSDNRADAVHDFVRMGTAGLLLERIPLQRALDEGIGECDRCKPPVQPALFGEVW